MKTVSLRRLCQLRILVGQILVLKVVLQILVMVHLYRGMGRNLSLGWYFEFDERMKWW